MSGEAVQRGRYAVHQGDGGGFIVAFTRGLCDTCAGCGCGQQAEDPLDFTPKGMMKTIIRARKYMAESGMKLPLAGAAIGGDGGPRRGRR